MTIIKDDQGVIEQLEQDFGPSLRAFVKQILGGNLDVHENQELADLVFDATPPEWLAAHYRQALTIVIPVINAGIRNEKPPADNQEPPTPRSGKGNRSSRMEAIEEGWYQQQLDARLGIPSEGSIPLRYCTVDQLAAYGASVVASGKAQVTNGRKYELLAKIGHERGYETGQDFPEDVLREVLT